MQQAFEGLHRTDVGEQTQLLAHSQQTLLRAYLSGRVVVELRITYGREEHSVSLLADLEGLFGEGIAYFINCVRTTEGVSVMYLMTKFLTNGAHHLHTLHGDLRADPVAGKYCDIQFHLVVIVLYSLFILVFIVPQYGSAS